MEEPTPPPPVDWSELVARLESLAAVQLSPNWDQEAYVEDVAMLMASLDIDDPTLLAAYADYADRRRNFPEIETTHESDLFELATLQFEPGESIDLHDHPGMTGVILVVSGDITIDNFDLLEERSASGRLLVERTSSERMIPGQIGTLTADRGNIHTLRAHGFTQLLDVFTPPYTPASAAASRWFARSEEPYQGRPEVFEAWETS